MDTDVALRQQVSTPTLNESQIIDYLHQHPDFFIRNAAAVEQMRVSHPVRGSVSLVEWQLTRQRKLIQQLQLDIQTMMTQARENQILFERLLMLQTQLAYSQTLPDMLQALQQWARKLGLQNACIRLFPEQWHLDTPCDYPWLKLSRNAFESLRIQRLGNAPHFLGALNGYELMLLLPQAQQVGSVALSLLGKEGELGVVMFTSRDPLHYQPGMGTEVLDQIATLLPPFIERWISRR